MTADEPSGPSGGVAPDARGRATPTVRLRGRADRQRHPWVYRKTIREAARRLSVGDEVLVVGADDAPVGRGFYHGDSSIAVRLLSRDPERPLDADWLHERIETAARLRRDVLDLERRTDAYRVVHSEGDGLSGLIVDRYADLLVVEFFSKGFWIRRGEVRDVLRRLWPDARVCFKVPAGAGRLEGIAEPSAAETGVDEGVEAEIREDKMRFLVRPAGHKTGFFLDQRDNRARLASLVRGKKFLDAFSYTGAFGIAARTRGKAAQVVAVDLDEAAVEQGRRNADLNRAPIEWLHEDCFRYLKGQRHAVTPFDVISLDPPKWASDRTEVDAAGAKYVDLNAYAMQALRPGGILLTCCCSGPVSERRFLEFLHRAAAVADRRLEIFHLGGAAGDHPLDVHCPESRYLKAVFGRVL